jgi:hypothetical protein
MTILFICHDTGNTNVLLNTADAMLAENPEQKITFLLVGEAAQKIFAEPKNAAHASRIILLSNWLLQPDLKDLNNRSLNTLEALTVYTKLRNLKLSRAIITCSCRQTARVPFQISELLTYLLQREQNFLYCGDFFEDLANNPYWILLETKWIKDVSILLALAQQQENSLKKNPALHIEVVGSTALDTILDAKPDLSQHQETPAAFLGAILNAESRKETLATLGINTLQQLLFISGSKNLDDDLKLLGSLTASLAAYPAAGVRIGVHPGTENIESHITRMVAWLEEREVAAQIVVTHQVAAKITNKSLLDNQYILQANLNGDQVFAVSTAVASAQPATIVSQAALQGLPAYCLDEYRGTSYLQRYLSNSPQALFTTRDAKKLTKTDLGLPNVPAAKLIGDILLGQKVEPEAKPNAGADRKRSVRP